MDSESKKIKPGRPMKYQAFIKNLDKDALYTPATIVDHGIEMGLVQLISGENLDDEKVVRTRIRHTLSRYAQKRNFPNDGDGLINIKGQQPQRAWKGSRWIDGLPNDSKKKADDP